LEDRLNRLLSEAASTLSAAREEASRYRPETSTRQEVEGAYYPSLMSVDQCIYMAKWAEKILMERWINDFIPIELRRNPDADDYEVKRRAAHFTNDGLRARGLGIAHPETGEPCLLYANGDRDGKGRYVLEGRLTRKRTGAYKTLLELLSIKLAELPGRKEGFIEKRKREE
jgi:hypothetical protein